MLIPRARRSHRTPADAEAGPPEGTARSGEARAARTTGAQRSGAARTGRDPAAISRFFGDKRVRKVIVGVAAGTTSLLSIPLLAHHPGATPPTNLREAPPPATAAPFPDAPPTTTPVTVRPEARPPVSEAPPRPPERPALDPALTGFTGVANRELTEPFPGIRYLRFTADGPHAVHVVDVDLSNPSHRVRVTTSDERNQTVSAFAASTGALVAINGDWFNYADHSTHGLAVGEGQAWPGSQDLGDWLFLACDARDRCSIDGEGSAAGIDPSWRSAVGGNGVPLVVNGEARYNEDPFYATDRHPRSAVGLTPDGRMLFVAAEGRQGDAIGMTFNEMAKLMDELGAERAMMLDGGGSTSLVLGGHRVNDLPSGSGERPVANHLAIVPA